MDNVSKKKKRFSINKLIWFILTVFIVSFITIPREETKADLLKIEVLEVQPGNKFELSSDSNINVTKLDMPTFISMVDELAGKYDVIYIGRKNSGLDKKWNVDNIYRDYSEPLDSDLEANGGNINFNNNNNSSYLNGDPNWLKYAQTIWYGTVGYYDNWVDVGATKSGNFKIYSKYFKNYNTNDDYVKVREYYSENDITNRRAKEVKKLIDSGQLVYIDEDVFDSDLQDTKLRSNFYSYYENNTAENLKVVSYISSSIIKNDYISLNGIYKRPKVELISSPGGDAVIGDNSTIYGDINNRKMIYNFSVGLPEGSVGNESYYANLYLDYNGDGLFKEEDSEKVKSNYAISLGNNNLEYKLDATFVGYLAWKLDICSNFNENIKTSVYGEVVFKPLNEENIVPIRVLQVKASEGNNLNLSRNSTFNDLIDEIKDYNISITTVSTSKFNGMDLEEVEENYDMIIIGFGDNFGNKDENSFGDNAVNILKAFDKANKSIMLTHDTVSLLTPGQSLVNGHVYHRDNYKLSQAFKDLIGQSRYVDPYVNNPDIPHDSFKSNCVTLGATVYSSVKLYEGTKTNYVKQVNSGQITDYPFKLTTLSNKAYTDRPYSFKVAKSHIQWYQLNLEDESLVPWYNIVHDSSEKHKVYFNEGDSRNFYYTYSIGNITYSGTGHDDDYTDDELRLLVNTIVKAYRGANEPPIITNTTDGVVINNNEEILLSVIDKPFEFNSNIYHRYSRIGYDKLKVSVVTDDGIYLSTNEGTLLNNAELLYTEGGIDIPLSLSPEYLASRIGQNILIHVDAVDKYGENAERKTIKLYVQANDIRVYHGVDKTEKDNDYEKDYEVFVPESYSYNYDGFRISNIIDDNDITKDFYTEVPFMAYIRFIASDATIKLSLDEKYAEDEINPKVYSQEGYGPKVYVVSNGQLFELGEMQWDVTDKSYKYNIQKSSIESINNVIESNVYCNIVIKYSAKTYRNSLSNEPIIYSNIVSITRNEDVNYKYANILVGEEFKKNLF